MFEATMEIHRPGQKLPLDVFVNEYLTLFQESVDLFIEFNPCRIHDHTCMRSRGNQGKNFCCDGCQYLTDEGCATNSIWCKLWVCEPMRVEHDEFWDRCAELKQRSYRLCRGPGGRYGLDTYILRFYSEEEYKKWKIIETSLSNASSM